MSTTADETLRMWGEQIHLHRTVLGLTLEQVAAEVGVRMPTVWRWEHGQMEPRRHHKVKLAETLHTDVRILFPLVRPAA